MATCSYCGRENEDLAQSCSGCGTPIPEAGAASGPTDPRSVVERIFGQELNARFATLILLVNLCAQVLGDGALVSVAFGQNHPSLSC